MFTSHMHFQESMWFSGRVQCSLEKRLLATAIFKAHNDDGGRRRRLLLPEWNQCLNIMLAWDTASLIYPGQRSPLNECAFKVVFFSCTNIVKLVPVQLALFPSDCPPFACLLHLPSFITVSWLPFYFSLTTTLFAIHCVFPWLLLPFCSHSGVFTWNRTTADHVCVFGRRVHVEERSHAQVFSNNFKIWLSSDYDTLAGNISGPVKVHLLSP